MLLRLHALQAKCVQVTGMFTINPHLKPLSVRAKQAGGGGCASLAGVLGVPGVQDEPGNAPQITQEWAVLGPCKERQGDGS